LKRSGSQIASEKALANGLGAGPSGGGKSLQRALKDPSKFWPHNHRIDEKEEQLRQSMLKVASTQQNHGSWTMEKEGNSYSPVTIQSAAQSPSSAVSPQAEVSGFVTSSDTPTPNAAVLNKPSFMTEDTETEKSISNLPPEVVLDVARLSDTSRLDLTLYNPQRSPPSTNNELSRSSLSSARYRVRQLFVVLREDMHVLPRVSVQHV
jgi:hypothetical protein